MASSRGETIRAHGWTSCHPRSQVQCAELQVLETCLNEVTLNVVSVSDGALIEPDCFPLIVESDALVPVTWMV